MKNSKSKNVATGVVVTLSAGIIALGCVGFAQFAGGGFTGKPAEAVEITELNKEINALKEANATLTETNATLNTNNATLNTNNELLIEQNQDLTEALEGKEGLNAALEVVGTYENLNINSMNGGFHFSTRPTESFRLSDLRSYFMGGSDSTSTNVTLNNLDVDYIAETAYRVVSGSENHSFNVIGANFGGDNFNLEIWADGAKLIDVVKDSSTSTWQAYFDENTYNLFIQYLGEYAHTTLIRINEGEPTTIAIYLDRGEPLNSETTG